MKGATCRRLGLAAAALAVAGSASEPSGDWPRLWGLRGDAAATGRLGSGRELALVEVWRRPTGSGYSGIAISGALGYTAASDGERDRVFAFRVETGEEVWSATLGPTYRGHDGSRDGPTSTPTVAEGRVFVVGPRGRLVARRADDGAALWARDLPGELDAPAPIWGFATSPLVVGDRLIVQVGGARHNLAAFDAATGALLWAASPASGTGYASPVAGVLSGVSQVVVHSNRHLYAVRPESGALLWRQETDSARESTRPPQILPGNRVLLQHLDESRLYAVEPRGGGLSARRIWTSPRLRYSYSPTHAFEGYLYGFGAEWLLCVDPADASVVWREKVGSGSAIRVGGDLVVLGDQSGVLRVVALSPDGYRERMRRRVFTAPSWTTPSWAGGRLLLRNTQEIVALEAR